MEKFSFKKEIEESWSEFSAIALRVMPRFLKDLYKNKPLFIFTVLAVIILEITVAYFLYDYFFAPQEVSNG